MRIARLRVFGFRGIKEADIRLGVTSVLIGPNNVGKTTIIEALALILGREGMVRTLTEHDFFGSNPQPADRIRIVATIVGFGHADSARFPDWFSVRKGVPKWFDPTTGSESATEKAAPFELACEIGFQARFDHDSLEVETCRYFYDDHSTDDVFVDDATTPVGIGLVRDIGLFLIPASRSWDRMISFGSELFRRVVSSEEGLPAESILATRDLLRKPPVPLEDDARLKPIIAEVNSEISSLFGEGNDIRLRLTATDSASVLDAVTPHFGSEDTSMVPARRQGSGLISLQSLFLLLHFGTRRIKAGKGFCLALEEPELHLPPNIQRRVLRRLKVLSSQVIVSTHSPLISGFSDPTEILVVSNSGGVVAARALLEHPLDAATPNAIRTLFQLRRVETVTALMSEVVLVPEGTFDFEWLSLLSRVVELQSGATAAGTFFSAAVGTVPTQNGAIEETVNRMRRCHSCVVGLADGDATGRAYTRNLVANGIRCVLRWPDEWTIEDVIGWIIEPAHTAVLAGLAADLLEPPSTVAVLVERLKSDDSKDPKHLKGDRIAYEAIARAISDQPACLARAAELLDGLARAAKGEATPRFTKAATDPTLIFQP
jgi:energy-coupling factor transporter ATP-binding protein EcfA2